jgi:hypothetical protein
LRAQIVEQHVEEESVELCLGQRIRPFELDRILRREHEEGPVDLVMVTANGHGELLHGFEQRRLGLRRRAIDFVGQEYVRKDRSGHERPCTSSGRDVLLDDVRAGHIGRHEIRRELDPLKRETQGQR